VKRSVTQHPKTKPQTLTHRDELGASIAGDNGEDLGGLWGLGAAIANEWVKEFVCLRLGCWVRKISGVLGFFRQPNLHEICNRSQMLGIAGGHCSIAYCIDSSICLSSISLSAAKHIPMYSFSKLVLLISLCKT